MKPITSGKLRLNIFLSVITSCVFAFIIFNTISNQIIQSELNSKINSFFSYVESGPVYFARINSSIYAQNQLDLAIENNQFSNLHPTSILISGGEQLSENFAEWQSTETTNQSCEATVSKDFQYPENLYSFRVLLKYDKCSNLKQFNHLKILVGAGLLALVLVIYSLVMFVLHPVFDSIKRSLFLIKNGTDNLENLSTILFVPIQNLTTLAMNGLRLAKAERSFELASQVSHDIRSPLAALEMGFSTLSDIPEENRIIIIQSITRIKNIADTLLKTNKQRLQSIHQNHIEKITSTPLVPLISEIVNEKKLQHKNKPNISLNFFYKLTDVPFEPLIQPIEFQRLLSNLINNAVESFDSDHGCVEISLGRSETHLIRLMITDTGRGMDESVISMVGIKGFTTGKESGNGLGLHHAKETIKAFGGDLRIHSKVGIGTTIEVLLPDTPKYKHPSRELTL